MGITIVNSFLAENRKSADKVIKTGADITSFTEQLKNTKEKALQEMEVYQKYLEKKYGKVTVKNVGKDQVSLDKAAKNMNGHDIIIAPCILKQMAASPAKAAYFERKIDYFFNTIIPRETALCAMQGLIFEPCGVVIHEDGTVTYISGCSDSPERVAEVNTINKTKRAKKAEQAKKLAERNKEEADQKRQEAETAFRQKSMAGVLAGYMAVTESITYFNAFETVTPVITEQWWLQPEEKPPLNL